MTTGFFDVLKTLFTKAVPVTDTRPPEPEAAFDEPVVLPIEDHLDLHPFAPRDIPSVVEEYIEQCLEKGFPEVRLIHGRGKGVQRRIVRSLLAKHHEVRSYEDAPPDRGGWGATVVTLRRRGKS